MRFHPDYKPLDKDWWSDDQGDIMAGQTRNGVYYDKYTIARGKKDDLKKSTPDGAYTQKDIVRLLFDVRCLSGLYDLPKGDYMFDSYDSYDNTCFVVVKTSRGTMTRNIPLDKIKKVVRLRNIIKSLSTF